ncbi:hypothetical protein C8Q80DRAFT_1164456 [Daedaleopsis nitida]|nr:hypothetical protein C8Q80DRAFT_1164456 [Daedaleopsis nitida]
MSLALLLAYYLDQLHLLAPACTPSSRHHVGDESIPRREVHVRPKGRRYPLEDDPAKEEEAQGHCRGLDVGRRRRILHQGRRPDGLGGRRAGRGR